LDFCRIGARLPARCISGQIKTFGQAQKKILEDFTIQGIEAFEKLGVNSTPTFFINGKKLIGDLSIDQMSKEIDPYLKTG